MKPTNGLTSRILKEMREGFFDLSPDGLLVYLDPMIGTMRHLARHLLVRVNTEEARLELQHRGQTVEHFSLGENVRQACEAAFGAYFSKLQGLCKEARGAIAA